MRTAAATVPAAPALGVGLQSQLPIAAAAGKEGPALLVHGSASPVRSRLESARWPPGWSCIEVTGKMTCPCTTKPAYAPEPHDVGRYTQAEVKSGGQTSITKTAGSVHPGLVHYVEALVRRRETGYDVVILQVNGVAQAADSVHILCIGRLQMRLAKEKTIIVKEFYST
uniref:Uncharacterized protein n=1 Tax=Zea mays TaxID=4577 RepID=A0A804QPM1_MAIZE